MTTREPLASAGSQPVLRAKRRVGRLLRRMGLELALATESTRGMLAKRQRYKSNAPALCLVAHDAYRHGAQILALELACTFSEVFGIDLHIVLLGPGPLTARFSRYGRVHVVDAANRAAADQCAAALAAAGVRSAIVNSTASGLMVEPLVAAGIDCVALVHELPALIQERGLQAQAQAILRGAETIVFPSEYVRDRFEAGAASNALVLPQGLAKRAGQAARSQRAAARQMLLKRFGIPAGAPIVLNAGYGDLRKGLDLFVDVGARVMAESADARFLWVGAIESAQQEMLREKLRTAHHADRFVFAPFAETLSPYLAAADVFALTSREDPFPTVLLQAQDAGLPVVAFRGAGGFEQLLARGGGRLADDVPAFARDLVALLKDTQGRATMSAAAVRAMDGAYFLRSYAFDVARLAGAAPPRVSVVVPNHNYARYLPERLRTILRQTVPVYEIIVLDDVSTDGSPQIARESLRTAETPWRVIEGAEKSASVFAQWRRGVEQAQGDYVWIAEADDLSDPRFLETLLPAFSDTQVVLSYAQSRQIDDAGRTLDRDYLTYVSAIDDQYWRAAHVTPGVREVAGPLAVKNTIPNVSACVFRKDALVQTLAAHSEEIERFRVAGDWMTYIRLLQRGNIAFDPRPLNFHRRHTRSVTASALRAEALVGEIAAIQAIVAREQALTPRIAALQRAYIEELREQFELTRPT